MSRLAILAALAALLATPAFAKRVPPENDCERVEGADRFRLALATATANRDTEMLRKLVHPQVHLDFGGGSGWETLRERLDDPDYRLWEELDKVQRLGCGVYSDERGGEIYLPYYWGQDLGTEDAFSTYIVTGHRVPFYAARDKASRQLAQLDWEVVTLLDEWSEDQPELAHVRTAKGREGYVAWRHLRSQVDYRLIAGQENGSWKITTFIAGD